MMAAEERKEKLKYTKIDGFSLPYVELVMKHGKYAQYISINTICKCTLA